MRRLLVASAMTLCGFCFLSAWASAEIIIRGPFGGQIVIPSSTAVQVGPGVIVSAPAQQPVYYAAQGPFKKNTEPVVVSKQAQVIRPDVDTEFLPPPKVLPGGSPTVPALVSLAKPIRPGEFAKAFKPGSNPARYEVLFEHPISHKPIAVPIDLPPGNPRITYCCNSLVFNYGRHEVEVRFQLGNKVRVTSR